MYSAGSPPHCASVAPAGYYFWEALERFDHAPALIEPNGDVTSYAALAEMVATRASQFPDGRGVEIQAPSNTRAAIVDYLACLAARRPVILIGDAAASSQIVER